MNEMISVIIPAYNAEKYIIECLDSIKNQTYKNIEIIVVDDGSTDNTFEVVQNYSKNLNNILLFHQENGGVCAARNKGLDLATGQYVMFVDADDFIPSDAIETLYNDIIKNDADMAVGRMFSDSEDITTSGSLEVWQDKQGLINGLEDNPSLYGCCAKLYKKSLIQDIRFVEGKKVHEDGYFVFLTLIKLPTIAVRDKCTYIYRYNPESASHAPFSDKYFDVLYFEERKRNIIQEKFPELTEKTYNKLVKAHLTMLHLFLRTKDKKYKKDIKNSIKIVREYSRFFIPAIKGEKKFFLIVKFGGYWLFRRLYWIKYRRQM